MRDYCRSLRLDGRGFVVLGTGAGIGGAVCRALQQAGAELLCVSRAPETAKAAASSVGGMAMTADVTVRDEMEAVFDKARTVFGTRFAGVVDVVGVPLPTALNVATDEVYDRQFDLTLRHAWLCMSIAGPMLADNGGGAIVCIGATERYHPGVPLYVTGKATLNALVRNAAVEFGPRGVRVNAIAAGRIKSSGVIRPSDEAWARINAAIPLRRAGEPAEIASATLFMVSDLAQYVTGEVLVVDGGINTVTALPG